MTEETQETMTLSQAIRKSAIGLAIFAFFTAGIIALTHLGTRDQIELNERAFEARLLLSLLPDQFSPEQILEGKRSFANQAWDEFSLLNASESDSYYQAIEQGQVTAVVLPVEAPEGYTEAIRLIVGIRADGSLLGVRVTRHRETPGLGDGIEATKSDWVLQFNDRSLNNPQPGNWQVKKDGGDFDQLTGATITPRAIVKAVKASLEFFELNQTQLLSTDAR